MKVGSEYMRILINGSILDNRFGATDNFQQLVKTAVQKYIWRLKLQRGMSS